MMDDTTPAATPAPSGRQRIPLHRQAATVRPGRIDVRPSREAIVGPAIGVLLGAGTFIAIVLLRDTLWIPLLALMLVVAIVVLPFSAMGLVYALAGANIVVDAEKNSVRFHQGIGGLGLGTTELVPFEKIAEWVVEEAGEDDAEPLPTEEFTQWQVTLVKVSGKRLRIGGTVTLRAFELAALGPVVELGRELAVLTDRPLVVPDVEGV